MAPLAGAAPLDDWITAAVDGRAETVVIVPRVDAVLEPVSRAAERIRRHPALAGALDGVELAPSTAVDLLRAGAAAEAGVDVTGPLMVALGPDGAVAALAVADPDAAGAWLEQAAEARPETVDGRRGWRWPAGVALVVDGVLYAAADDAGLARIRRIPDRGVARPDPLADCPRGRGEADLFVVSRSPERAGCLTGVIDAGRVRLDARLTSSALRPADWLAPGAGLPTLAADPALAIAVSPGPTLAARLAAAGPPPAGLELAVGPGPLDILFAMRPAGSPLLERLVEAARGRDDVTIDGPVGGLRRIAIKPAEGRQMPPVTAVWLGAAHDRAWIGTDRAAIERGPGPPPKTGLSPDLFAGAGLVVYLRPGGLPHDGGAWADAVAPRLTAMGVDMDGIRRFAGGFAWLWAHLGEVGLAARAEGPRWVIALEGVTL